MAQTSKGSSKARTQEARQRAQARREAIARAERRRRYGLFGIGGVVALVVILVIVFVVVNNNATKKGSKNVTAPAAAAITTDLASVAPASFETAGVAGVGSSISGLSALSGGTPITTGGLPTVVYVGAEYCPYCAAERWVLATALSRFGTFSGLQTTMSDGTDVYPNTATLDFVTTKFTSKYVAFAPSEVEDRSGHKLQTPGAAEAASAAKYGEDAQGDLTFPFVSIDNKYKVPTQYDPGILKGMTADQIAAAIKDPTSAVGKQVLAAANVVTAGICSVTGQQPTAVCSSSAVEAAGADLDSASSGSGSSTG